jgi:hypothetical protein
MNIWTILRYTGIALAIYIAGGIIASLILKICKSVSEKLNDEQNSPEKALFSSALNFAKRSLASSVVSQNGVTIAYQRALSISLLEDDEPFLRKTDEKIREILRLNPEADFQQLAPSLEIVVSSVQRGTSSQTERLMTICDTTILYHFNTAKDGAAIGAAISELQRQITEILSANPTADLFRYEDALGITIANIQRRKERPTTKGFNG